MIIITNPHFSQNRVSRDSLPTQSSNLVTHLKTLFFLDKDDVDFNDFAKLFRKGAVPYGNYWTILKSAWRRKDHPNLKILWFEEMKSDMMKVIRDVAYFIGHPISEYKVKVP